MGAALTHRPLPLPCSLCSAPAQAGRGPRPSQHFPNSKEPQRSSPASPCLICPLEEREEKGCRGRRPPLVLSPWLPGLRPALSPGFCLPLGCRAVLLDPAESSMPTSAVCACGHLPDAPQDITMRLDAHFTPSPWLCTWHPSHLHPLSWPLTCLAFVFCPLFTLNLTHGCSFPLHTFSHPGGFFLSNLAHRGTWLAQEERCFLPVPSLSCSSGHSAARYCVPSTVPETRE